MSKPTKTEAELIAMAMAELKAHLECPEGMMVSVLTWGDNWEFRAKADPGTAVKARLSRMRRDAGPDRRSSAQAV